MQNTKILRMLVVLYGMLVAIMWGGFVISLYKGGDLMLLQPSDPSVFLSSEGIGEISMLFMILWGVLFALLGLSRKKTLSTLCMIIAVVTTALLIAIQLIRDPFSVSWLLFGGIAYPALLLFLPLVSVKKVLTPAN